MRSSLMSTHAAYLEELVTTIVPETRQNAGLKRELITHCQEILNRQVIAYNTRVVYLSTEQPHRAVQRVKFISCFGYY